MCDYCNEKIAIEVADAETLGRSLNPALNDMVFFKVIYLQETKDFISAFQSQRAIFDEAVAIVRGEKDFRILTEHMPGLQVSLCRMLDILVNDGFDSEIYQTCIVDATLLNIISIQHQRSNDEPLLADLADLQDTFASDVLSDETRLAEMLSEDSAFVADCKIFLSRYIKWQEKEQATDIDGSYNTFFNIYPYAFLSMVIVLRYFPDEKSLTLLIQNEAKEGKLFEGLDLWLQRKTSIGLYKQSGLTAFLPYTKKVRPVLVYYLLVKGLLSADEKRKLKDIVNEYLKKQDLAIQERNAHLSDEQRKDIEKLLVGNKAKPSARQETSPEEWKRMIAYIAVHELILTHG